MQNFIRLDGMQLQEAMKGALLGTIQTKHLTVAYTDMKAGVVIPLHQHPEEAVDIILEGELEMQIGDVTGILKAGMITLVPGNIPHTAKAIKDSKVVTVFYPRRSM
jgi:quercetin dioxygenase-like cupin family protein